MRLDGTEDTEYLSANSTFGGRLRLPIVPLRLRPGEECRR
jgi:hypothetical protein